MKTKSIINRLMNVRSQSANLNKCSLLNIYFHIKRNERLCACACACACVRVCVCACVCVFICFSDFSDVSRNLLFKTHMLI